MRSDLVPLVDDGADAVGKCDHRVPGSAPGGRDLILPEQPQQPGSADLDIEIAPRQDGRAQLLQVPAEGALSIEIHPDADGEATAARR